MILTKRLFIRGISTCLVLAALVSTKVHADIISQWNFNGASATTVPGGASAPTPSVGSGTASLVGGAVGNPTFPSGTANGGSSDPVNTTPNNYGWGTSTYPAQGTGDRTAGVQFNVSTVGFAGITVSWDTRSSNTSARHQQFQYSTDGTTFTDFGTLFANTAGDTWFNQRTVDLSSIPAVDNNPNFAFRLVAAFDPALVNTYTGSGTTYAPTGTLRFDMVTVSAVPEPTSIGLFGLACIGAVAVRRRGRN